MLHATKEVNGPILWANLHLLFRLSVVPFVTGWKGENHFATIPTAFYGIILFLTAVTFTILQKTIVANEGPNSLLATVLGSDGKGKLSVFLYVAAIVTAFIHPLIACALYVTVAVIWPIPDRRIERALVSEKAARVSLGEAED